MTQIQQFLYNELNYFSIYFIGEFIVNTSRLEERIEHEINVLAESIGVSGERIIREVFKYVDIENIRNYHIIRMDEIDIKDGTLHKDQLESLKFEIYLLLEGNILYSYEKVDDEESQNFNKVDQTSFIKLRQAKDVHVIELRYGISGFLVFSSPKNKKKFEEFFGDIYSRLRT